jgi:thymidylate kinase
MRWWIRVSPFTRAPVYTLLGVDGAGKSSLSTALVETIRRSRGFSVGSIYMGSWGHYRLRFIGGVPYAPGWSLSTREWLRAVFGRVDGPRPSLQSTARVILKMSSGVPFDKQDEEIHEVVRERSRLFVTLRYLRSVLSASRFFVCLMLEMYYRYFLIYRMRRRGQIVITDRYIYDLLSGRMHEIIPNYRRLRRFLCRIFFRPTRAFLLKNDAKTIMMRSEQLDERTLRRFMAFYDELAVEFSFETIWTNDSPERTANLLIEELFDEIVSMTRI